MLPGLGFGPLYRCTRRCAEPCTCGSNAMYKAPCLPKTVSMLGPSEGGLQEKILAMSIHRMPHLWTKTVPREADVLHLTRQSYLTVVVLTLAMPSSKLQHGICWELCCGLLKLVTRMSLIVSTRGAMLPSCRNVEGQFKLCEPRQVWCEVKKSAHRRLKAIAVVCIDLAQKLHRSCWQFSVDKGSDGFQLTRSQPNSGMTNRS